MTTKQYAYVNYRAFGMTPLEAYMQTHPKSREESAVKNCLRYENNEEVQELIQEYMLADKLEAAQVRREVVARCMRDSRDDRLPIMARFRARELLVKIYGLDKTRVEVSADEAFRRFLMNPDGK